MEKERTLLKKPLVIVFICLILGSILFYIGLNSSSIVIMILFFIILYILGSKKEIILFILFIALSLGSNYLYYKINVEGVSNFTVRIKESYYGEYIGIYNGRKISIKGTGLKLSKGKKYLINGYIKTSANKDKGIVGVLEGKYVYGEYEDLITHLYNHREYLYNKMKSVLNEENAALISAVSFGYVDELTLEQKEYMKYYGLVHIISVSGFHMALVYKILNKLLDYRITLLVCIFYSIFTGASAPTLRSLFMIIILKLGESLYKNYEPLSALCLSGIVLCLLKPYNPLDLGFQLSYLATLGIILFNNKLDRIFYRFPKYIREVLTISISPQLLTYPIVGVSIGYFSLNFILSNLILMPFFTIIVVLGNLLLLVSFWDGIFVFTLKICEVIQWILNGIINNLEYISLPLVPIEREIIYYYIICFGSFIFVRNGHKNFKKIPLMCIVPIAISIYSPFVKINIEKNKEIRISNKGQISKYIIENNRIKVKDSIAVSNIKKSNKYVDKIPLGNGESYILLSDNILGIKTPSKEIYCFSLNKKNFNYDIIGLNNNEKLMIINNKVIRF